MRRHFGGQKPRPRYDHDALAAMAQTMTSVEIIQTTGISAAYLDQVLAAKGVRARGKRSQTKTSP